MLLRSIWELEVGINNMMEFLNAFKFVLMMFINPWVLIPATCAGIFVFIVMTISLRKGAKLVHKIQDPLDWIDDGFWVN